MVGNIKIEERAKEHFAHGWEGSIIDAYVQGATEQKAVDDKECETMVGAAVREAQQVFVNKACEWFKYNAWSFGNCAKGDTSYDWEMAFECFRKSMED